VNQTYPAYRIEPATDSEREWTATLITNSEPWRSGGVTLDKARVACAHPQYLLFVAHSGDHPCGAILLHPLGVASSPYIKWIVVEPEHRSHRVGRTMIQFAEDLFRKESKHLFLCVSRSNQRARSLYQQIGFAQVGELNNYFAEGDSEILMHKRLA